MAKATAAQHERDERRSPQLRKIAGLTEHSPESLLIHERLRLAIVSALAVNSSMSFSELKDMLDITDGNLSVHARKLEEGGLIQCAKSFVGRMPRSEYKITAKGKKTLERYLEHMESLIKSVRRSG